MKPSNRTLRVAQQIQVELAKLIPAELKDPRLGVVTITGVEVTRDFAYAKVFVVMRDDKHPKTLVLLNKAAGFLRRRLAKELLLRTTPELSFHLDQSIEYGARIDNLLRRVGSDPEADE